MYFVLDYLHRHIDVCALARAYGEVDLQTGSDYCSLIPTIKEKVAKNLQLMESAFGMCAYDSHSDNTMSPGFISLSNRINYISSVINDNEISVELDTDFKSDK